MVGCLQCLTGRKVEMVSFHRPAKFLLGRKKPLAIATYQPQFLKRWRIVQTHAAVGTTVTRITRSSARKARITIATHPIWWTKIILLGVPILDQFANNRHLYEKRDGP